MPPFYQNLPLCLQNFAPHPVEVVRENHMPPASYLLIHSNARLTTAERETLIAALEAVALAR